MFERLGQSLSAREFYIERLRKSSRSNPRIEDLVVLKGGYRAIYPYFNQRKWHHSYVYSFPPFVRDRRLAKKYFHEATIHVGEALRQQMADVLGKARGTHRSVDQRNIWLDKFAHALRAWIPFVSYGPFVILKDQVDQDYWVSNVPDGPQTPSIPPELSPTSVPELPKIGPDPYKNVRAFYEEGRNFEELSRQSKIDLKVFTSWQDHYTPSAENDPKQLAIYSYAGYCENGNELKQYLYTEFPILLLLRRPLTPQRLISILKLPVEKRRSQLDKLIDEITQKYQESINVLGKRLDDGDWHLLRPITKVTKLLLLPEVEKSDGPLGNLFDIMIENIEPLTPQDYIWYGSIALTLAIVIISGGTALPALATTLLGVAVDSAAVGLNTYLNHLDNIDKDVIRRFALLDKELDLVSPNIDLTTDAIFMALSYLIPYGGGAGVKLTKKYLYRKINRLERALIGALDGPLDPKKVKGSRGIAKKQTAPERGFLPEPDYPTGTANNPVIRQNSKSLTLTKLEQALVKELDQAISQFETGTARVQSRIAKIKGSTPKNKISSGGQPVERLDDLAMTRRLSGKGLLPTGKRVVRSGMLTPGGDGVLVNVRRGEYMIRFENKGAPLPGDYFLGPFSSELKARKAAEDLAKLGRDQLRAESAILRGWNNMEVIRVYKTNRTVPAIQGTIAPQAIHEGTKRTLFQPGGLVQLELPLISVRRDFKVELVTRIERDIEVLGFD